MEKSTKVSIQKSALYYANDKLKELMANNTNTDLLMSRPGSEDVSMDILKLHFIGFTFVGIPRQSNLASFMQFLNGCANTGLIEFGFSGDVQVVNMMSGSKFLMCCNVYSKYDKATLQRHTDIGINSGEITPISNIDTTPYHDSVIKELESAYFDHTSIDNLSVNIPVNGDVLKEYNASLIERTTMNIRNVGHLFMNKANEALKKIMTTPGYNTVEEYVENNENKAMHCVFLGVVVNGYITQGSIDVFVEELNRLADIGFITHGSLCPPMLMELALTSPSPRSLLLFYPYSKSSIMLPIEELRKISKYINREGETPKEEIDGTTVRDIYTFGREGAKPLPEIGKDFLAIQFDGKELFKEPEECYGDDDRFVPIDGIDDKYVAVRREEYEKVVDFFRSQLGIGLYFLMAEKYKM